MAENNIRISKVIKEFNIGLGTLTAFLKKKGIEVEESPNAKISAEAYEMVKKEYNKDQKIKEDSRKVPIRPQDITRIKKEEDEIPVEKEVFIKTEITERPKLTILGNIRDLNRKREEHKAEQVKKMEPAAEKAAEKLQIQAETSAPETNNKKEATETVAPAHTTEAEVKPETNRQQQNAPAPASADSKADTTPDTTVKATDRKDNPLAEIQHIETVVEKLTGPKTLGTIDLSVFDKKKTSGQKQVKGKRERIQKQREKVDINKEARKDKPGMKPSVPGEKSQNNPKNQNQKQGNRKNRKEDKFKPVKVEIDEDAVQKQIKETYARMTESKSKTKASKHRREKREQISQKMHEEMEMMERESTILNVTEFVTVNDLSTMINVPVTKVIEACMNLGLMVSINQRLDAEALVLVAEEFGYKINFVTAELQDSIQEEEDKPEDLVPRPPIITVMGHVDHGKTSLLDNIRRTNVIAGEAGGITQHIGAYNVLLSNGRRITFLDTPGHEAFTAMRARGAKITDLAIIIIAADDAIMPQTVEAINHAQAAGVPMVFAINKIDKPGANPEKIREQLANMNILVEDWGGKYQCQEISAKKGLNVDLLLEKVLLEADMLDLKANPNKRAVGTVIESSLDKGRGYLATVLVQTGTMKVGDVVLSGCFYGKVKAMFNERGQKVSEAGPSTPVSVLGLNGAPTAGENFNVMEDEKEAKDIANKRDQLLRIQGLRTQKHITLEEIGRRIAIGNFQELNIIVKGDVDGSVEALSDSLIKLSTEEIHVNVIHKAVGAISESDVLLAAASNAIIIGFQVRPSSNARKVAEKEEIEIRLYSVIYDAINEVKSGIEGMLAPEEKEEVTATAEVRETFKISKVGTIAGCMVKEGKLTRNAKVRVIRDGIVVYTGELGSLKRFKDDVKEVLSGYDCGLNVSGYNDIKIGDVIEAYTIVEIKRTL